MRNARRTIKLRHVSEMKRICTLACLIAGVLVCGLWQSPNAWGFAITIDTLTNSSTSDFVDASGDVQRFRRSSGPSVTSSAITSIADVPGAVRSFSSRYVAGLGADSDTNTDAFISLASSYLVSFTVVDPLNLGYQLVIDTGRIGAATVHGDSSSGNVDLFVGTVIGSLNLVNNANLGLGVAANIVNATSTGSLSFNQANQLVIVDVGNTVFDLRFDWTSSVRSDSTSLFGSGDGGAVRLGIGNVLSNTQADNYPGIGNRNINGDGHFLDVAVTLQGSLPIPEPGTLTIFAFGLAGLGFMTRRRRREAVA